MIRSRVWLRMTGLNQSRLLSELTSSGIGIWELKKSSYNEMSFAIYAKDYKKLLGIVDPSCYTIKVEQKTGLMQTILKNWHRCGLLVGVFFTIYLMTILSTSIWSIDYFVDGDAEKLVGEASHVLESMDIRVGTKKQLIDPRELEKTLQAQMPSASIVVVEKSGSQLIISIKQATEPVLEYHKNIISVYDAIIESIEANSGVIRVDIGDIVTKGQVLIEVGMTGDVFAEANGKIMGRIFVAGDAIGSLTQKQLVRSGRSVKTSVISIWGKTVLKGKSSGFVHYETESTVSYISPYMLLPIEKETITYHELIEQEVTVTAEVLIERLKQDAYKSAKTNFPVGEEESKVSYSIISEGDLIRVVCTIEGLTQISIKE